MIITQNRRAKARRSYYAFLPLRHGSSTVAAAKKYYCDKYDPDAAVILKKIAKTVIHNKSSYIIYVNQMSILIC